MDVRIAYELVRFKGHPNIRARHSTTLEITKDPYLTPRGDCIIGVSADKGLKEFSKEFRTIASRDNSIIFLLIITEAGTECVVGRGSERLTFRDPTKIIVRKSAYTSPNTVMIKADKSALELRRDIISYLRSGGEGLAVFISALLGQ